MARSEWLDRLEDVLRKGGSPVLESIAPDGTSDVVSAANIWTLALERKRGLTAAGYRRGDILVESAPARETLISLVACAIGGLIYCPVRPDASVDAATLKELVTEDSCLVLHTSGTASGARAVVLSGSSCLRQIDWHRTEMGIQPESARLMVLPHTHCFGLLLDLLVGVFAKQTIHIRNSVPLGSRPLIDAVADHSVSNLALVPRQLFSLVQAAERAERSLNGLLIHTGGAFVPSELRQRALGRGARLLEGYGLTECTAGVLLDGRLVDGCEIRLKDSSARSGLKELWVRTPHLGRFHGREVDLDGFYRTGDLAVEDARGIRVLGRTGQMVKSSSGVWQSLNETADSLLRKCGLRQLYLIETCGDVTMVIDCDEAADRVETAFARGREIFGKRLRLKKLDFSSERVLEALQTIRKKGVDEVLAALIAA